MSTTGERWKRWRERTGYRDPRAYDKTTRPLQVRVDPETRREVESYARKEKITIAEALRRFIDWGLAAGCDGPRRS